MGTETDTILTFENGKFYLNFASNLSQKHSEAKEAGLMYDEDSLRWVTRSITKAVKFRQYADAECRNKFKKYFITDFPMPESISFPGNPALLPHQLRSVLHALTRSPAYIADEAGLGKTITAIVCLNTVRGRTIIVCPPYLKYNWHDELVRWCVKPMPSICVVDPKVTTASDLLYAGILIVPDSLLDNELIKWACKKSKFTWLIIDEAHRFKNENAIRTKSLIGDPENDGGFCIAEHAKRIVLLSGTPIPNGKPIELYPMLHQLSSESVGHRTKVQFGKRFCQGRQVVRYERGKAIFNWDFSGAGNLGELKRELREKLMIRHLKKDVLKDLPDKTRKIVFLDTPKELLEFETDILKHKKIEDILGEETSLGGIAHHRREIGLAKIEPSLDIIRDFLENSDEKLVVFAHHIEIVDALCDGLQEFGVLKIRGGISALEKKVAIDAFQTKGNSRRVIVGNMESMGLGNTLTAAQNAIVVEPSWVPGVNEQAEDRLHRITQKSNVYIKYLVLRGSLDERILKTVLSKESNINQVMSR